MPGGSPVNAEQAGVWRSPAEAPAGQSRRGVIRARAKARPRPSSAGVAAVCSVAGRCCLAGASAEIAAEKAVISAQFGSRGKIAVKKGPIALAAAPKSGFDRFFPKIRAQNTAISSHLAKFDKIAPQKAFIH